MLITINRVIKDDNQRFTGHRLFTLKFLLTLFCLTSFFDIGSFTNLGYIMLKKFLVFKTAQRPSKFHLSNCLPVSSHCISIPNIVILALAEF